MNAWMLFGAGMVLFFGFMCGLRLLGRWKIVQSSAGMAAMAGLAVTAALFRAPWPLAAVCIWGFALWGVGLTMDLADRDRAKAGKEWWQ